MAAGTLLRRLAAIVLTVASLGGAAAAAELTDLPVGDQLPVRVAVATRILDIAQVMETTGQLNARVELTYRWTDSRQAFDAVKAAVSHKDYFGEAATARLRQMWTPAIDIENLSGAPRQDQLGLVIESTGAITLVRRLDATFRVSIDMSSFPFDVQTLDLDLTSNRYGQREVLLVHTEADEMHSSFAQRLQTPLWRIRALNFRNASYVGWNGEPHSRMSVSVVTERLYGQYLIRIFIPFLMLMSSTLVILWTPDTTMPLAPKGALAFTTLLALVALSFTFESNFPGSMSTGTPIAQILSIGYLYVVSVLILSMLLLNKDLAWAKRHPNIYLELSGFVRWGLPGSVFVYWSALVLRATA
ncbi:hypothetical protein E8L99_20895 [Phreatobacter aquaticus]|uniref:Neurotransmitter-gated ion-channel ligand-binding domain-containing protein n=1 Tax=Phreatobacter aquaticus TaxID=2570229 RepID=A0A4D7QR10_9HYPH|nr:hypothetical protein [Phreatobacter aquaticus]QCK88036.1 hypothetical protein E8L99_20895 [Phreatobacter aquaticus]